MRGQTERVPPCDASPGRPDARRIAKTLRCLVFGIAALLPAHARGSELRWSPDGRWLAFAQTSSPQASTRIRPGWLFKPDEFRKPPENQANEPETARLWIVRADSGIRYQVDSSDTLLSDPCWSPGGESLIYARIVKPPGLPGTWSLHEVYEIASDGPKSRILRQIELPRNWKLPERGEKTSLALRQLHVGSNGLIVHGDPVHLEPVLYDTTSQEVRARFPDGYNARIGPGGDSVAWLKTDHWPATYADLVLTTLADGRGQILKNMLPDAVPVFSADGQSMFVGRLQNAPKEVNVPPGSTWPDIAKVDLKTLKAERYSRPIVTPILPTESFLGFSVTLDAEEENLLCAPSIRNRPAEICWFQPRTASTYKRFPPLDVVTSATDLAISPDQRLALRLGTPEYPMETNQLPAAICDPRSEALQPLVPDAASMKIWVDFLATAALRNLSEAAGDRKRLAESPDRLRVSLVPTSEEASPDTPAAARMKRIGNAGLAALGFDPKNPDIKQLERLTPDDREAACLFLALTRRYEAALAALAPLATTGFDEESRFRRFAVLADLNAAAGNVQEGYLIYEALKAGETRNIGELAPDGMGGWLMKPHGGKSLHSAVLERLERTLSQAEKVPPGSNAEPPQSPVELPPAGKRSIIPLPDMMP